tara:strand:- start:110 stop:442 length:333 start_codon:yes stop_codon:yes gene_type:complete
VLYPANLGAHLELPSSDARLDRLLFAEGGSRILVSVPSTQAVAWQKVLNQAKTTSPGSVFDQYLGVVTADEELLITQAGNRLVQLPLNQLRECFEQAIPRRMGLDLSSSV